MEVELTLALEESDRIWMVGGKKKESFYMQDTFSLRLTAVHSTMQLE